MAPALIFGPCCVLWCVPQNNYVLCEICASFSLFQSFCLACIFDVFHSLWYDNEWIIIHLAFLPQFHHVEKSKPIKFTPLKQLYVSETKFQPSMIFFLGFTWEKSMRNPGSCQSDGWQVLFLSLCSLQCVVAASDQVLCFSSCQPAECSCFTCLLTFVNAWLFFLKLSNKCSLELVHQQRQFCLLYKWLPRSPLQKTLVQQSPVIAAGKIWALGLPEAKRPWHLLARSMGSSVGNNWAFHVGADLPS